MLLRRTLIRAGFGYHRLLTLSMAYVALPQGAKFLPKFPKLPENRPFKEFSKLVRSEPSQRAVAVWFVTKETWPEIRAGLPEPGQAFAAAGEAENVSITSSFGESLAGFHRVESSSGM
jgi:hypothetical protein